MSSSSRTCALWHLFWRTLYLVSAATSDVPSARRAVVGLRGWGSQLGLVFPGGSTGCSAQAEEQWRAQLSPCCSLCPSTGCKGWRPSVSVRVWLLAQAAQSPRDEVSQRMETLAAALCRCAPGSKGWANPARAFPLTHRRRQELNLALGVVHPAQVDFSSSSK